MKKNIAMRVAAFLFILTMITTCAFATTFAKYTTKGEAEDSARVAKWGVKVILEDVSDLDCEFETTEQDVQIYSTVSGKLLAPGSTVYLANVNLSGTPEVAVNVSYEASLDLTGWQIGTDIYCPLIFKVGDSEIKWQSTIDNSIDTDADGKISTINEFQKAVEAAIEAYSANYGANQDLSDVAVVKNIPVSCSWKFAGDDVKDTALGDAATAPKVSLTVKCTVTQID